MEAGKEISFTKSTLKFWVAGMFIPGFTAIVIFDLQQAIQFLGVECSTSWRTLWTLTTIGAIVLPIIFYKDAKNKIKNENNFTLQQITIFNIVEIHLASVYIRCSFYQWTFALLCQPWRKWVGASFYRLDGTTHFNHCKSRLLTCGYEGN